MEKVNNDNLLLFDENYNNNILSKSAYKNIINDCLGKHEDITKSKSLNGNEMISIIIPTHNRLNQVKQCINSILSQTYKNIEIIIIDDVSSDDTEKYFRNLKNKKIRYYRNKRNLGIGLNRQKGYNLSFGDFIIFCDDDDYFIDNDYFKDAIDIFKNKNINLICSSSYIHYESEDLYKTYLLNCNGVVDSYEYLKKFQFKYKKPTSTFPLILRKSILEKAKFENMKMMNDSSIYLRALIMGGNTFFNNKIIGVYRVHNSNVSSNVKPIFTIKNFKEKKYVYKYLKKQNVDFKLKKWYKEQIKITASYFLKGSSCSNFMKNIVLWWIRLNVSNSLYHELKSQKNKI